MDDSLFRAMFYLAPVGLSIIGPDGCYLAVNPVRCAMLGYAEEEMVGHHYLELTHEEDIAHDQAVNQAAAEAGRDRVQLEKRFMHRDGTVMWTRISASTVRDTRGETRYSISVAEDITAQRASGEERARLYSLERESRIRLTKLAAEREAMLGQIAEGIIIADPEGRITFVNRAARAIHGMSKLDVPIEQYAEAYHLFNLDGNPYPPDDLPLARAVQQGETTLDAEWLIRRPDGISVVAQGSAVPVTDEEGRRLGAVLTVRDVTNQHQLEVQKDQFLSAVAHDLRTPLTSVKGRVQMLLRRLEMDALSTEQLADGLARVDSGAARMVVLINELLEVANIQLGRPLALSRQPANLVLLGEAIVRELQQVSERHTIELRAEAREILGNWDVARLERVLANLLSNAIKYSPAGGRITVRLTIEYTMAPMAVLSVVDEGIGIPADDLPHVFERFRRGRNVNTKIAGTGIGLAAVRDIVEQHGGMVTVQSAEGIGTTFTVRLPIASPMENEQG